MSGTNKNKTTIFVRILAALLAVVLLVFFLLPTVFGASVVTADEARKSVFRVVVRNSAGAAEWFGSAFVVGQDATSVLLLTNYHVVSSNEEGVYLWLSKDEEIACTVVGKLTGTDIALLRPSAALPNAQPLPLGTQESALAGDDVYALGFPTSDISDTMTSYAEDVTVSKGALSKKTTWKEVQYYQTDVAINGGNSGGPLLHSGGYVIGICTMKMESVEGISGAIMIEEALPLLDQYAVTYAKVDASALASAQPAVTPIPVTTVSPQATDANVGAAVATDRSSGIWTALFIVSGVLFVGLIGYLFLLKKRGKSLSFLIPPRKSACKAYVLGKSGAYAGAVITVGSETLFFGRDPQQCQLVFSQDQSRISRVHCSLRYEEREDAFILENYSKNGTFLADGRPVEDGHPVKLKAGDGFSLADGVNAFELIGKNDGPIAVFKKKNK